jgi:hypothetical protein
MTDKKADAFPFCRFCGQSEMGADGLGGFVNFGERHNAHALCYLLAGKNADDLDAANRKVITVEIVKEFLWRILCMHGLYEFGSRLMHKYAGGEDGR